MAWDMAGWSVDWESCDKNLHSERIHAFERFPALLIFTLDCLHLGA